MVLLPEISVPNKRPLEDMEPKGTPLRKGGAGMSWSPLWLLALVSGGLFEPINEPGCRFLGTFGQSPFDNYSGT